MKLVMAAGLVLYGLASLSLASSRVETWTDEEALWASAVLWSPAKIRPSVEYGRFLHLAGRWDEAEVRYRRAIALWTPDRPPHEAYGCRIAVYNLALLLQQRGRWAEADEWGSVRCD